MNFLRTDVICMSNVLKYHSAKDPGKVDSPFEVRFDMNASRKRKNLIDNYRGKIEQDGCNNQSRTDYCTIFHPSDYFQQGLLKEIQCPVVHPLHVWNSFLELNR